MPIRANPMMLPISIQTKRWWRSHNHRDGRADVMKEKQYKPKERFEITVGKPVPQRLKIDYKPPCKTPEELEEEKLRSRRTS